MVVPVYHTRGVVAYRIEYDPQAALDLHYHKQHQLWLRRQRTNHISTADVTDALKRAEHGTVYLAGHDLRIPVPDGPEDDPAVQQAEDEAVLASPAFQARLRRARANKRAGKGIPAQAMDRYLADLDAREYSGSLRIRMPKHLHQDLARQAEHDGVSLNTLIIALLERGIGAVAQHLGKRGGPV